MHLLNSVRTRMRCIPVVHEVAAGIATEYYNATRPAGAGRAFALVTAGPGVTNIVTAMAGAYLESRELLVVAGQVKSSDLSDHSIRQRGIQEVDACALTAPVTKATIQIREPITRDSLLQVVRTSAEARQGPAFIDFCLDAQSASPVGEGPARNGPLTKDAYSNCSPEDLEVVFGYLRKARRPVFLLGGGVSRALAAEVVPRLEQLGVPIATTWNALDRIPADSPVYAGRPDTWGMRWANLFIQQADLVIAVGARLSLQQTGFNWQRFAPLADVVHVDIDSGELAKVHPAKKLKIQCSAEAFLTELLRTFTVAPDWSEWRAFAGLLQSILPLDDPENYTAPGYMSPYRFVDDLSAYLDARDIVIPCSSGGASTVLMQAFQQKRGQVVVNNKALASMGYGLLGAIGAACANRSRRVILVEGDGGFAQNIQELGTVGSQQLAIKMFVYENRGYASIRMTQKNYFDGAYVGCDEETGVGFPDWQILAEAFGVPVLRLDAEVGLQHPDVVALMSTNGPALFVVPVDPEQTYFPKISSRITPSGDMESSPLHLMSPPLAPGTARVVMPYLEN